MDETVLEQRLSVILAADAAGYSRLMAADERATLAALEESRAVFRDRVALHRGRVIDMAGDSVLAEFGTAKGAIAAAVECQKEIAARCAGLPAERMMLFRIGVHLGDVIAKPDGTVYGDGINIAARLQALARPGGVTVSEAVRSALRGTPQARFTDRGEHVLKNIPEPLRAYDLEGAQASSPYEATVPVGAATTLSLPDRPSIAVLPFANMSGDAQQEYFCDGITEDIITELSRFRSLFVIARNSTFTYKGKAVDVRTVARELGVRYVLEGSIRRDKQRIRLTAQLIDAATGAHVWAERYDRVLADIFDVQEELTSVIVAQIAPHVERSETERARSARPDSITTYELGLRAWAAAHEAFRLGESASADDAILLAREALRADVRCGLAWRSIAAARFQQVLFNKVASPTAPRTEGIDAATRAVAIDAADGMAYAYRGMLVLIGGGDPYSGLADLRRAHELNPNHAFVLALLGTAEAFAGNGPAAIEHSLRAVRLSPCDPMRYVMMSSVGWAYFCAGDYEQSRSAAHAALAEAPSYQPARACLIVSLVGLGHLETAKAEFQRLAATAPEFAERQLSEHSTMFFDPDCRQRRISFVRMAAGVQVPTHEARAGRDAQVCDE